MGLDLHFDFEGRDLIVRVAEMGGRWSAIIYEGERPVSAVGYATPVGEDLAPDTMAALGALMRLMRDDVLCDRLEVLPRLQ